MTVSSDMISTKIYYFEFYKFFRFLDGGVPCSTYFSVGSFCHRVKSVTNNG